MEWVLNNRTNNLLYIIILIIFRLMGKREIGELSVLDLVVFIMLGEMAVVAIENTDKSLWHQLVPMIFLCVYKYFVGHFFKVSRFSAFNRGDPTVTCECR